MNTSSSRLPLYLQLSQITIGLLAFFFILDIAQQIIVPLIFATLIAILLNPLVNFLSSKKINRIIAIILALTLAIILFVGLAYFIGHQMGRLSDSFPMLKSKFMIMYDQLTNWIAQTFNISKSKMNASLLKSKDELMHSGTALAGKTLGSIGGTLGVILLLPVYIFMILFYKSLLLGFISQLFDHEKHAVVAEVLVETKSLIQNYLIGLLIEACIVAVLNSIGLLLLGVQYAILLGIIGALLNIIPYIGGMIALGITVLMAVATNDNPSIALWVIGVFLLIQFIDNNYLVPNIVASKVKMNALISIVVVLIGGALWGVTGMFLSIPLTAIFKVIFDRVEGLKPYGFLIGDNQPPIGEAVFNFKSPIKIKRKKKE